MSSETTVVAARYRLQEWAAQIRDCQNRPEGMSVSDWCSGSVKKFVSLEENDSFLVRITI